MTKLSNPIRIWAALFLLIAGTCLPVMAQQATADNWTISAQTTPAQCESDGTIAISNQNGDALINFTYSLLKKGTVTVIKASSDNTFYSVPPGIYTVKVNADSKKDPSKKFTRTLDDIVVGGDYKVLDVTFNPTLSRPSYAGCNRGSIVLNIANGRQENLSYRFLNAPTGVATQTPITATKNADGTYKLAGDNYPAGSYKLEVSDNCVTRSVVFSISELSHLPTFKEESFKIFYSEKIRAASPSAQYSCSSPLALVTLNQATLSNKELMRYIEDGLFEIGLSTLDKNPRDDQFQTLLSKEQFMYALDMSPSTISGSYSYNNTHKVVIRLKDCPSISREFPVKFMPPKFMVSSWLTPVGCTQYTKAYLFYKDYDGLFCFPVTINLRESETGPIIKTETFMSPEENLSSKLILDFGKTYYYEVIDATGKQLRKGSFSQQGKITFGSTYATECGAKYIRPYKSETFSACPPYTAQIINLATNEKIQDVIVNDSKEVLSPPLQFDVKYRFVAIKDGLTTFTDNFIETPKIKVTNYASQECKRDVGEIRLTILGLSNGSHTVVIRQNTRQIARRLLQSMSTSSNLYISDLFLPPGKYQLDISTEGCPTVTHEFDWKGFYNRENFAYDSQATCAGLEVTPRGNIIEQGKAVPEKTFFRILSGPEGGYSKSTIPMGEKFQLTQSGTYLLGIVVNNKTNCALDTIVINYERSPLKLNTKYTSAYACVDGTKAGHILIKAQDGVPPYRYELWNEEGTHPIVSNGNTVTPLEILPNGVAHFVYGVANDVYTVKVIDKCGNSFKQQITIRDLSQLTIADAQGREICEGESIQLLGIPLENYEWYLPNAKATDMPFSREQNPVIPNAKVGHSGIYVLKFKPQFCGKGIEGSIEIKVHPCYAPINPQLMTKVMK